MYCSLLLYQTHKKGNKRPFSSVEKRCKSEKDVRSSKNTFVSIVSKMMVVEAGGSLVSSSINEVESYNAAVTMLANYSVFYVIENHPHSQGDKWDMTSSQAYIS